MALDSELLYEIARGVRCDASYPDEFIPGKQVPCDGSGVLRFNGKTGKPFMGCSLFPRCLWSRDLTGYERSRLEGAPVLPGF